VVVVMLEAALMVVATMVSGVEVVAVAVAVAGDSAVGVVMFASVGAPLGFPKWM